MAFARCFSFRLVPIWVSKEAIVNVQFCLSNDVVRSILLPVTGGRQIGEISGPPLTCDISGSSSSNEQFSIWFLIIFDVLSYGIHAIAVR